MEVLHFGIYFRDVQPRQVARIGMIVNTATAARQNKCYILFYLYGENMFTTKDSENVSQLSRESCYSHSR